MALNNLLTEKDVKVINDLGIAGATLGIICVLALLAILLTGFRRNPQKVLANLRPLPTQILYSAVLVTLVYSVCFLITCSDLASNDKACKTSMWGTIVCIHIMNGLCATILLHCGLLLSSKNAQLSSVVVRCSVILTILFAVAMGTGGLIAGRYGFLEAQDTCWIIPAKNEDSRYSAYRMEAILLYGPMFFSLLVSFFAVLYIWYLLGQLHGIRDVDFHKTRSLVLRLSFPPACLIFHCMMIIGGDLPIKYHSRSAQYASYALNYIGLASFGVALAVCALITDPAFKNIFLSTGKRMSGMTSSGGETNMDITIVETCKSGNSNSLVDFKDIGVALATSVSATHEMFESTACSVVDEKSQKSRPMQSATTNVQGTDVMPVQLTTEHVCTSDGDCCIFLV